ncbi:MAG: M56 family metallopeptidase, partial [Bacteroidales bacterium]|nr:M56 family metallopeptidase [Bacteroidales bacterium]
MSAFGMVFTDAMLQTAGIALLHSLWQSGLVALVTFLLLKLMHKTTAQSRYLIAAIALLATLVLPVVTFIKLYQPALALRPAIETSENIVSVAYTLADTQFHIESWFDRAEMFVLQLAPLFFWFWLAGMIFMALRMSGGYFLAYRFRRVGVVGVGHEWEQRLKQIGDALHVKTKVVLLESVKITVPMVVGILKPCIILPLGTLSRLPFDQVEMILAHELAHIKRADFMVNIFQSLIETILFFNPFVWWISSVIRAERENICDDMALMTSGKNLSLVKALANLAAAIRPETASNTLITFNQINTMKRIERLIRKPKL